MISQYHLGSAALPRKGSWSKLAQVTKIQGYSVLTENSSVLAEICHPMISTWPVWSSIDCTQAESQVSPCWISVKQHVGVRVSLMHVDWGCGLQQALLFKEQNISWEIFVLQLNKKFCVAFDFLMFQLFGHIWKLFAFIGTISVKLTHCQGVSVCTCQFVLIPLRAAPLNDDVAAETAQAADNDTALLEA